MRTPALTGWSLSVLSHPAYCTKFLSLIHNVSKVYVVARVSAFHSFFYDSNIPLNVYIPHFVYPCIH